jgi:hypothetical protein
MQDRNRIAASACHAQQFGKHRSTNTSSAPGMQHGHAPDMAVGQQASGRDWLSPFVASQYVQTLRIEAIPFKRFRYALLFDEYLETDRAQLVLGLSPGHCFNSERSVKRHDTPIIMTR